MPKWEVRNNCVGVFKRRIHDGTKNIVAQEDSMNAERIVAAHNAELSAIEAECNALSAECDALSAECDALTAENVGLRKKRDAWQRALKKWFDKCVRTECDRDELKLELAAANATLGALRELFPEGSDNWCLNCKMGVKSAVKNRYRDSDPDCLSCGHLIEEVSGEQVAHAMAAILYPAP